MGRGDADSWGTPASPPPTPLQWSPEACLGRCFSWEAQRGMDEGWMVCETLERSISSPRVWPPPSLLHWSSRAQFGGSGGNPLAPAMPEVGADGPSGLTWRPSTSEALPALWGLAYGLRASPAVPRAMGGRAQRIFGAHHQSRCPRGGGRWSVSGGSEGWGVEGSQPWGRASLSQQRKARR